MNKALAGFAIYALFFYLIAYGVLYHFRCPAANLSYWAYSESTPDWAEMSMYYGFYR